MKPSFLSLFKRGRYLSAPDDGDDTDEARKLREERERFAVAVLAFCLRHDEGFRKHFWERICRTPDDPDQMPPITESGIGIEPPEWADLSLTSDDGVNRYMWVIEAKAGAPLQRKQNPKQPEFLEEDHGYGALLDAATVAERMKLRYIVLGLGANDRLGIRDGQKRRRISVQERSWAELLKGLTRKGIVKDLIDTFAELRIGEFYMEKARSIAITGGLNGVGKAWTVCEAICKWLGLHHSERHTEGNESDEEVLFGVYVKQANRRATTSKKHTGLVETTGGEKWCVAWFGYAAKEVGVPTKSVRLYCRNEQWRDDLLRRVKELPGRTRPFRDGDSFCIAIDSSPRESSCDFDWFVTVFDKLLVLGPPRNA